MVSNCDTSQFFGPKKATTCGWNFAAANWTAQPWSAVALGRVGAVANGFGWGIPQISRDLSIENGDLYGISMGFSMGIQVI